MIPEKHYAVAVDGPSGAGKSTLLKAITGIMEPTGGHVAVHGSIAALLELASLPGGFCPAAAERAGDLAARGLPGVYAPEAAAAVIRRAIFRELDLEECP